VPVDAARALVRVFLDAPDIRFVAIGEREFDPAADAYARFGKGRHPAAPNMGDCLPMPALGRMGPDRCSRAVNFGRTDIAAALDA